MAEVTVKCPVNDSWIRGMTRVLPETMLGKLEPFKTCVKEVKAE